SYDEVRAANPRIVYASLLGFGSGGPYAGKPAYDDLIQGACALPALLGRAGGPPAYVPANMADRVVPVNAVHVNLAALLGRERATTKRRTHRWRRSSRRAPRATGSTCSRRTTSRACGSTNWTT